LPFRMPVENYQMEELVRLSLGDYLVSDHIPYVSEVLNATLGPNPRAFKRLANSFFLIHSVLKYQTDATIDADEKTRNALIFCALALQLALPHVYSALLTLPSDLDGRFQQLLSLFVADELSLKNITNEFPPSNPEYLEFDAADVSDDSDVSFEEEPLDGFSDDFFDELISIGEDAASSATLIRKLNFSSEEIRSRYLSFSGISPQMEPGEWDLLVPTISALDIALQVTLPGRDIGRYDLFAEAVSLSAITSAKKEPAPV